MALTAIFEFLENNQNYEILKLDLLLSEDTMRMLEIMVSVS